MYLHVRDHMRYNIITQNIIYNYKNCDTNCVTEKDCGFVIFIYLETAYIAYVYTHIYVHIYIYTDIHCHL